MNIDPDLLLEMFQPDPGKQGRLVTGAGDGMQDEVPAVVLEADEQQPALLSSGEFVMPAWAVSALGNGDSNSGAQQLSTLLETLKKQYADNIQGESATPFDLSEVE